MTEVMGRLGRRGKQLLDDLEEKSGVLEIDRGNTRWHTVEN
jgi:hypothetical protein